MCCAVNDLPVAVTMAALDDAITRGTGLPSEVTLVYRETRWAAGRPTDYQLQNEFGQVLGDLRPAGDAAERTFLLRIGDAVRALVTHRRGTTIVAAPEGQVVGIIGQHRSRMAVRSANHRPIGTLDRRSTRGPRARIDSTDGRELARIERRVPGASGGRQSCLELPAEPGIVPIELLLSAVPILDTIAPRTGFMR